MASAREQLDSLMEFAETLDGETGAELKRRLVSLRKTAKEELGLNFKEIVDHLTNGIYVTDGEGVTLYVNPAYVSHTGIRPEEIVGRSVVDISREGVYYKRNVSSEVIRTKSPVIRSGLIRNVDGKSISGQVHGVPILDENGEVKTVVVTVYDREKLIQRSDEIDRSVLEEGAVSIVEDFADEASSPMVGQDEAIQEIRRTIVTVAATDVTVLITGESGVGKEIVAERIYSMSSRHGKPYVRVNCAAIPANLLESELFGYEKGAFTGAKTTGKAGMFELANHGTILLDEIGDLPFELQTKLLRVLQEQEVMRIGGTKPISLDVRVIASTNANLKEKIREGKFREDLYYRLSVVPIHIPPLRERPGDVLLLVRHYFNEYCKKHGRHLILPEDTIPLFESYSWPGNVRELQNVMEYLVIFSKDELNRQKLEEALGLTGGGEGGVSRGLNEQVADFERRLIRQAIEETGGIRKAAAHLQVDPSTISRKAKKYGLDTAYQA